jgi:glyoxylase-like metal-dependent hydrolase (beta-lactamase superfamily II)
VAVHPADAAFVRDKGVTVEDALTAGDTVGPFRVLAAAGKSPGEVVLHWPERRLLVIGDACVGPKPGVLGLLPAAVIDDPAGLRASLRRLADEVDADTLLLGDGHAILAGGREALRTLAASFV